MREVSFTALAFVGKEVLLRSALQGADRLYPAGSRVYCSALQADGHGGYFFNVAPDLADLTYLENCEVDDVEPLSGSFTVSLDLKHGLMLVND